MSLTFTDIRTKQSINKDAIKKNNHVRIYGKIIIEIMYYGSIIQVWSANEPLCRRQKAWTVNRQTVGRTKRRNETAAHLNII